MWFIKKFPIPGEDARWCGYCPHCKDYTSFASRNGFKNGGIAHCYDCGKERKITGIKEEDIQRMIISCKIHWEKFPPIPYNWHKLSEKKKNRVLGINNEV